MYMVYLGYNMYKGAVSYACVAARYIPLLVMSLWRLMLGDVVLAAEVSDGTTQT